MLVAEPVQTDRERLIGILAELGYEVASAATGEEAWRLACGHPPDLAIVAERLPDTDSAALCPRLRTHPDLSHLPILLVTERPEQAAERVLAAGADDYLSRPFDPAALRARVRLALQQARKQQWFETLRQACDQLARARELHGAFVEVTRCLRRVLPVDHFVVALEQDGGVTLEVVEAGAPGVTPIAFREHLSQAEACPVRLADHGRPYVVCDAVRDKDPKLAQGMQSCVCVPLNDEGRRVGALSLASAQPAAFGAADLSYLESLALLVAHTVANIRRYRQARGEAERLAVIVREVHHRIKNNLQGVIGLLGRHRDAHPETAAVLNHAISQLHAVSETHNLLSRQRHEMVRVHRLIEDIGKVLQPLCAQRIQPELSLQTAHLAVPAAEAVPLALVLNELIQNAVTHGYPDGRAGTIRLGIEERPECVCLTVADDGRPLPATHGETGEGLGLSLVRSLLPGEGACLRLYRDAGWTIAEVCFSHARRLFVPES